MTSIPDINWIFVDDGSTDDTAKKIEELSAKSNVSYLTLDRNRGKAEAVRQGLLKSVNTEAATKLLGFIDADRSFEPREVSRFLQIAQSMSMADGNLDTIWASRVALIGRDVKRSNARHYTGRLIATLLSLSVSQLPYDSQAGFKLFKNSASLKAVLDKPFKTRWLFDVELLQRWAEITGEPIKMWEEPLNYWHDTAGSHISLNHYPRVIKELAWLLIHRPRKTRKPKAP